MVSCTSDTVCATAETAGSLDSETFFFLESYLWLSRVTREHVSECVGWWWAVDFGRLFAWVANLTVENHRATRVSLNYGINKGFGSLNISELSRGTSWPWWCLTLGLWLGEFIQRETLWKNLFSFSFFFLGIIEGFSFIGMFVLGPYPNFTGLWVTCPRDIFHMSVLAGSFVRADFRPAVTWSDGSPDLSSIKTLNFAVGIAKSSTVFFWGVGI